MWLSLSWYGGETRFECKLPATRCWFSISFYSTAQSTLAVIGDSEGVGRNADSGETTLVSDYCMYTKIRYYRYTLQELLLNFSGGQLIWHYCFTVTRCMFACILQLLSPPLSTHPPLSTRYHPIRTNLSNTRCIADTSECLLSDHMRCGDNYKPWVSRRMYSGRGVNLITYPSPPAPRLRTSGAIPLHHNMAS